MSAPKALVHVESSTEVLARKSLVAVIYIFKMIVRVFKLLSFEIQLRLRSRSSVNKLADQVADLVSRCEPKDSSLAAQAKRDVFWLARYLILRNAKGLALLEEALYNANASADLRMNLTMARATGRKKILYVTGMFPCLDHGGGLRLFDVIRKLSKNHDVDLFTGYVEAEDRQSLNLLKSSVKNLKLVSYEAFTSTSLIEWFAQRSLAYGHYDVIQFEYPNSVNLIMPLRSWGRRLGFTFMECTTLRDLIDYKRSLSSGSAKFRLKSLRTLIQSASLESTAVRSSDFSIATGLEDATFAQQVFGRTVRVLATGISDYAVYERLQNESVEARENVVMFLGNYRHTPNLEALEWYLRKVHPEVKAQIPDMTFEIVGTGDLSNLKNEFGEDRSIVFVGRVDSFVPAITSAAVCVAPVISGAGTRGKINQYSAAGRPTVTTLLGSAGQPYRHNQSIFIADEPKVFAVHVISLLTDKNEWKRISEAARETAHVNFSWDKLVVKLEQIYEI